MPENEDLRALAIAELSPLRSEVNATVDRMTGNENFCAGSTAALLSFAISRHNQMTATIIAVIALLIPVWGLCRYIELRAHARRVDRYLLIMEKHISNNGGWSNTYYSGKITEGLGSYSATRIVFWIGLLTISLAAIAYARTIS